MANIAVAKQDIVVGGLAPSYTGSLSISDTYQIPLDGRTFLHVKKTGAGACTVTISTPRTVRGLAISDQTVTVPATTGDRMIGPFNQEDFADASGLLNVTFSEITGLSFAALRLQPV